MAASARPPADPGQNPTHPRGATAGRTERMIELVRYLERERKITKERLYAIMGVSSQSSFKRVKGDLARASFPITYDPDDGHYHVPPSASIARYGIDPRTRAQLAQVRAAVAALGGPASDALDDVLTVLEARVALDDPDAVAVVSSRHPQPRADAVFWTSLDRALTAVREHRWLSFAYSRTTGGVAQARTIQPYAVHTHDGRYYVWGILEGEHYPKLFALDGMHDVAMEADTFEPDPGLAIDDALQHSFGTMIGDGPVQYVAVRVAPEAAAFARCRRWPAEIGFAEHDDGSVVLTFAVSRFEELVAWVLSFSGTATIESPAEARAALRNAAERVVESTA